MRTSSIALSLALILGGGLANMGLASIPLPDSRILGDPPIHLLGVPVVRSQDSHHTDLRSVERITPTSLAALVVREANYSRRSHGVGDLIGDPALTRAAVSYARELARRGEIEHLSPTPGRRTFRERIAAEGARPRLGGENLARLTASPTAVGDRVVSAWLRSPGHRVNLLDPIFSKTGVGVWLGGDGVWYVVQLYSTAR